MAFKKFAVNTHILIGDDVCAQIGEQASLRGATHILLVSDEGVAQAGIVDRVCKHIDTSVFKVTLYTEVQPDPTVKTIDKGAVLARESGCDLVVAVGGGSSIDAGKGISVVAPNGGSSADYEGLDKYKKPPIPLFSIPTTCGTGSEVTFGAVLTNSDTNYKFILYGYNCAPQVAFLDPLLLLGIPRSVLVPSGMDALTHAIESCLSKGATPQSKPLALEAIRLITRSFQNAFADNHNKEAITDMLYAANIAGMAFATSRLGIVHAMALPLGAFFHVPHGIANTILLPHGLEYNFGYDNAAYCEIAAALGEDVGSCSEEEGARKVIVRVKTLQKQVDAPHSLSAVGVKEDKIALMARDTMKSSHIPANPREILENEVAQIYRAAL